jgi:endonuclease YncB( thermonuclease family)
MDNRAEGMFCFFIFILIPLIIVSATLSSDLITARVVGVADADSITVLAPGNRQDYDDAENYARAERLGLWADKNPTPPWEWRRERRRN